MIVVDVETGGLDPKKNPLLSIGAVDFDTKREFYGECSPLPMLECTQEALKVNGIDLQSWEHKRNTMQLMVDFLEFVSRCNGDRILAGHNPSFDLGFVNQNFKLMGLKSPFGYRTVDLHSVAYIHFKKNGILFDKLSADEIYKILGMSEEPKPHNALIGAQWESLAFNKILIT